MHWKLAPKLQDQAKRFCAGLSIARQFRFCIAITKVLPFFKNNCAVTHPLPCSKSKFSLKSDHDYEKKKICSDSQQYPSKLCLIKHCIKYPCFPFWKLNIFCCGFITKVTWAFLDSETMVKWRFQRYIGHAITWNSACIPFKYNYIV